MTVRFDTAAFVRSHGKAPKGTGVWGFEVFRREEFCTGSRTVSDVVFTPRQMSFSEAKAWARHQFAGRRDVEAVSVAP